jgi:hypothetical protein
VRADKNEKERYCTLIFRGFMVIRVCGPDKFTENEIKLLPDWIEEFYYWYDYSDWEGSGTGVSKAADGWRIHDIGHCSCYGPTERIEKEIPYTKEQVKHLLFANYPHGDVLVAKMDEIRNYVKS